LADIPVGSSTAGLEALAMTELADSSFLVTLSLLAAMASALVLFAVKNARRRRIAHWNEEARAREQAEEELLEAVRGGDLSTVERLCAKYPNIPDAPSSNRFMKSAVGCGHVNVAAALLKAGFRKPELSELVRGGGETFRRFLNAVEPTCANAAVDRLVVLSGGWSSHPTGPASDEWYEMERLVEVIGVAIADDQAGQKFTRASLERLTTIPDLEWLWEVSEATGQYVTDGHRGLDCCGLRAMAAAEITRRLASGSIS
jgi:hypothetical protein